ncbi:MAG TPA: recombinase family protein [Candidatus Limnocylindria bacterium]|jgi:DNA invertase Pin-like site-specific DNA recombinase|nr:recombinase family protein [Candidatus Limnocylindria bacterium]
MRLSRSQFDFARIVRDAQRERWSLAILDLGLDMSTPQGQMMAGVLSVFAEFERNLIAQRTRDAMRAKMAAGHRFGAPRSYPLEIRKRINFMRMKGLTYAAIADMFNTEGIPTAKGGRWYPMTVFQILKSQSPS